MRQRPSWGGWRLVLVALAVGLLLGFAGPFGSMTAYSRGERYAFWMAMTVIGVLLVVAATALLPEDKVPTGIKRIALITLLSALPLTFVVAWTMSLLSPGRVFTPLRLPTLFAAVSAVQLLIVFALAVAQPTDGTVPEPGPVTPVPAPAFPSALLGKVLPELGRAIVALETEDHYLRLHTAAGSTLILMRMADAVALIDPRLGVQVHRRWWVAEEAVASLGNDRQRLVIRLTDGRSIPVGRTFAAAVRARFA